MKHVDENNEHFHLFICIYSYYTLGYFVLTWRNQLSFPATPSLKKHQENGDYILIRHFHREYSYFFQPKAGAAEKTDNCCRNSLVKQNCSFPALCFRLSCAGIHSHPPANCPQCCSCECPKCITNAHPHAVTQWLHLFCLFLFGWF